MENGNRPKRLLFITGPTAEVEEKFHALGDAWVVINQFHHVIRDQACVTLTLVPVADLRAAEQQRVIELGGAPYRNAYRR